MSQHRARRSATITFGAGLVLLGLSIGVLTTVLLREATTSTTSTERVVERVQLGNPEPPERFPMPESLRSVIVEPTTLNHIFRRVADRVTPAVVYITVEVPLGRDGRREWYHNFEGDSGRRFFDNPLRQSVGSGVLISADGYVVTNSHVVENAQTINVTLSDKRLYEARLVGADPSTDLAVLKVEDNASLPVIDLGDSDQLQVGEWVLAIGNPFRLTSTVTAGIVSALGRQVNIIDDNFRIEDFIQTDAAINPGNSGGAVVNLDGELIGIATAIATESGSYEGYGFAVPVNLMARVVGDLIEHGEVQRGFLGVTIQDVDAGLARRLGMDRIEGVHVQAVTRGGAAERGGVRSGDVIVSIDHRSVNAANELQSVVARRRPGDAIDVTVWRRGQSRVFTVELLGRDSPAYQQWFSELRREAEPAPREERAPAPDEDGVLEAAEFGLGLRDVTRLDRGVFDVDAGAYVAYVTRGSLADAAGVPRDVVLLSIAGRDVDSSEEAVGALEEAARREEAVLLRVKRRDGITAFYEMDAPARR